MLDWRSRRRLGSTRLSVTGVCFGTSPLGSAPDLYGYAVDEDRAVATIRAVFDSSINFLDTSNNYGAGKAESRIGVALRQGQLHRASSLRPRSTPIRKPTTFPGTASGARLKEV